jgi:hypothetical protein
MYWWIYSTLLHAYESFLWFQFEVDNKIQKIIFISKNLPRKIINRTELAAQTPAIIIPEKSCQSPQKLLKRAIQKSAILRYPQTQTMKWITNVSDIFLGANTSCLEAKFSNSTTWCYVTRQSAPQKTQKLKPFSGDAHLETFHQNTCQALHVTEQLLSVYRLELTFTLHTNKKFY